MAECSRRTTMNTTTKSSSVFSSGLTRPGTPSTSGSMTMHSEDLSGVRSVRRRRSFSHESVAARAAKDIGTVLMTCKLKKRGSISLGSGEAFRALDVVVLCWINDVDHVALSWLRGEARVQRAHLGRHRCSSRSHGKESMYQAAHSAPLLSSSSCGRQLCVEMQSGRSVPRRRCLTRWREK